MKQSCKIIFILVYLISGLKVLSYGQTTIPFTDDFEGLQNWTIVNGTGTNGWYPGNATSHSSSHSMYISDDGGLTNGYDIDSVSVVHFYKDFIIPPTLCAQLSFFRKGMGEPSYDYLKVFAAPDTVVPQAGTEVSAAYLIGGPYLFDSVYTSASLSITAFAGDTVRLIFSWKNDGSFGTQPPASIDDIQLTANPAAGNDLPCHAISAPLGVYVYGNNTCSTNYDEPLSSPPCFVNPNPNALNTIWYKFTAPASGCIKIKTFPANFNAQVALYGGISGNIPCDSGSTLNYIACNNDSDLCPGGFTDPASILSADSLTPGLTYYLMVDGYQNITGNFTILFIDGGVNCTNDFPPVPFQDCVLAGPICSYQLNIPNPGYQGIGNVCDFGVPNPCTGPTGCGPCATSCLCSGERASAWYKLHIIAAGLLQFDIVPNDWTGATGCCSTDYDFAVYQITSGGIPGPASCSNLISPIRCNYSALGVTGIFGATDGVSPPVYPGFGPAYRSGINVIPGDSFLINVSNFTVSTSGFVLSFANTPAGVIDLCTNGNNENANSAVSLFTVFPSVLTNESVLTLTLKKPANVKIELIDITGQHIDILPVENKPAGETHITFGKKSLNLSSGFYFIKATVSDEVFVKKIVVQ